MTDEEVHPSDGDDLPNMARPAGPRHQDGHSTPPVTDCSDLGGNPAGDSLSGDSRSKPGSGAAGLRSRIRARLDSRTLVVAGVAAGSTIVVVAAVIGAPVDYKAAEDILLVLFAVGVHWSVGALLAAAWFDTSGDRFHRKFLNHMADFHLGGWIAIAVIALASGGFWYVTVTYSTILAAIVVVAGAALTGGFLVGWRAARVQTSKAAKARDRLRNVTTQYEPAVGLAGAVIGFLSAVLILLLSAYIDTSASQRAPKIVTGGSLAQYGDYVALGDSYSAGEGINPVGPCHQSTKAYGASALFGGEVAEFDIRSLLGRRHRRRLWAAELWAAGERASRSQRETGHIDYRRQRRPLLKGGGYLRRTSQLHVGRLPLHLL